MKKDKAKALLKSEMNRIRVIVFHQIMPLSNCQLNGERKDVKVG